MNFTGERFIPGQGGSQIAYEHVHRYLFALRWAEGKQVLDLACGNGYGAAILARRARHVWAIDLDENTLRSAAADWPGDHVSFIRGDATQLPFQDRSMELVVAMEALEHIRDQEKLVGEMARVCSADGSVLISTPNKAVYSDARQYVNPFHIGELYLEEFAELLRRHFPQVQIAGQQVVSGSLISCTLSKSLFEVITGPDPAPEEAVAPPMYFIAVCSFEKPQEPVPAYSAYLDASDRLVQEVRDEGQREVDRLNREISELGQWAEKLEDSVCQRDQAILDIQRRMAEEVELRDQTIRGFQDVMKAEVAVRDRQINDQDHQIIDRDQRIVDLLDLLHQKEREFDDRGKWALSLQAEVEHLTRIHRKFLYKVLSRLGLLPR